MKRFVFLSNSPKPTKEQQESREEIKLSNVSKPCLEAAVGLGYEVYLGVNRGNPETLSCSMDIKMYDSHTYRSLFDLKSNYIAYKNLMKLLKDGGFEVIHCNTPIGGVIGRICGRKAKIKKVIYTAHGFHFYKGAPFINRTLFKWSEMWMAHFTDAIITMNQEDFGSAQKFKLRKNGKVYYVPGVGVNTDDYIIQDIDKPYIRRSLGLNDEAIVLISMGDLIYRKNYETSIRAIAKSNNNKLHFLICGTGPKLEELKNLAIELNVEKQIHFLGFRSDVKELLQISDIFLFTTFQEGLSRSMMEAMASGLPCIASKIRGNVDLIDDGIGGYLREPDDVDGFVEAIAKTINNNILRQSMSKHNLKNIKKYDVKNIKIIINNIYNEVLNEE